MYDKDWDTTIEMVCVKCGHVAAAPFRYDHSCGDLIALDSSGEECEVCGHGQLEEVE